MSEQTSAVLSISSQDIRVTTLGLSQLAGTPQTIPAHEPLTRKLRAADGVLSRRGWLAGAERALTDPDAPQPLRHARPDDTVEVRLTLDMLRLAAQAAQAFLDRPVPVCEPFGPSKGQLIDPPERVLPTLRRYQRAVEVLEGRAKLAAAERALLD